MAGDRPSVERSPQLRPGTHVNSPNGPWYQLPDPACSQPPSIHFAESSLPSGLVSGDPVLTYVGGTAAPGTYGGVKVTATDSDGAVLNGTFTLVVHANSVYTPGNYGDEVNPFGNGFDVYQEHQYAQKVPAGDDAADGDHHHPVGEDLEHRRVLHGLDRVEVAGPCWADLHCAAVASSAYTGSAVCTVLMSSNSSAPLTQGQRTSPSPRRCPD